ncbi:hypothetical protein BSLG_002146 [Batrachochytrium salamandrivorans]|nr:hypothetical protein BSLG_002146 [Batrachochytrium salamandrivorans]
MKLDYKFSNLCGTVYKTGNVVFTPDGNSLVSPVGNRVSVFDLVNNKSYTMPFENRKDIARIALSPNAALLITVDGDGRALLINFQRQIVLHHHNFKAPVYDLSFSPDGRFIAVTHEKQVHIWKAPGFTLEFAPFVMHRVITGHYDQVTSLSWSSDSRFLISSSKDMTSRIHSMNLVDNFPGVVLTGHNDAVVGAWFSKNNKTIFTVGRDGALFEWTRHAGSWALGGENEAQEDENPDADGNGDKEDEGRNTVSKKHKSNSGKGVRIKHWKSSNRHYFNQNHAKVVSAVFHAGSGLLSVGFDSGIFGIWELPDFANIHTLSISQKKINTVAVNASGEWLAFGSAKLGQLLVWEWQSESYVLKQQGHQHDMNCLGYSPDGQFIATGGDDGKVKLWNTQTGFCFVTFTEHSGGIVALDFAKRGHIVFSASMDGTVRAFDLVRYRNFRTFTSPTPVQFSSLAVDPSGEIVCAGSSDSFEIYVWSVQTGRLLDILPGHEGPISGLAFSLEGTLASSSWDQTVRIWDIFSRDKQSEMFDHQSEISTIDGRKDISGGRGSNDKTTAANSSSGSSFTSICFTADGAAIIAGGNSKYVCIYDVGSRNLLKKFQISHNLSLDGMLETLNSKNMTEAGPMDLIDQTAELSDLEDRIDSSLPGVHSGDKSLRRTRPSARTKGVRVSPTGRSWAAASTEGLLVYSLDERIIFDPFDLEIDITPDTVREVLAQKDWTRALVMAFRLGEQSSIQTVYETIPALDVSLVVRDLPPKYLERLIRFIVGFIDTNPRLEFHLEWSTSLATHHGRYLQDHKSEYASSLRGLSKVLQKAFDDLGKVCMDNTYLMAYLIDRCSGSIEKNCQSTLLDGTATTEMDVDKVTMASMGF